MATKKSGPASQNGNRGDADQRRHDWAAIKRAFVEGVIEDGKLLYPGPSKLAELFGAPRVKISGRANKEGWETERALRQRGVAAAADVQKASILAAGEAMEEEACRRAAEHGDGEGPAEVEAPTPTPEVIYGDSVPLQPKPVELDPVRRTLNSAAVALATTTAAFDAKAVKIAEAAMAVGAKLLLGREIRDEGGKVTGRLPPSPKEYRDTVDGIKVAHAMGRLALGQTTDNQGMSSPTGGPIKVDSNVSVDPAADGTDKLSPAELARLYAEAVRTRPADGEGPEAPGDHESASRP